MQTATVTASQPTGQWQELFKFEVTLSDGATGTVFGKTPQLRFAIGEEVEYEIPKEGRLKLSKPGSGASYGSNTAGAATSYSAAPKRDYSKQSALQSACTFLNGSKATKEQVVFLADYFANWLKGPEAAPVQVQQASFSEMPVTAPPSAPVVAQAPAPAANNIWEQEDGLPF